MSVIWDTKWGRRSVKNEPPAIAEALIAADCISEDPAEQLEIAASLMGVPVDAVKAEARKARTRTLSFGVSSVRGRPARPVVIEKKRSRKLVSRLVG